MPLSQNVYNICQKRVKYLSCILSSHLGIYKPRWQLLWHTISYLHLWASVCDRLDRFAADRIDHVLEPRSLDLGHISRLAYLHFVLFSQVLEFGITGVRQSTQLTPLRRRKDVSMRIISLHKSLVSMYPGRWNAQNTLHFTHFTLHPCSFRCQLDFSGKHSSHVALTIPRFSR